MQEPAFGVGDIENVLGALTDRHDLGADDRDAFGAEDLADFGEQSRAIRSDQFEDSAAIAAVDAEIHLRRSREHADLARGAARHRRRGILGLLQVAPQAVFDFANAAGVGDDGAVVLEHHIGLEAEAIGAGDQPCVHDVETHLIEHRGGSRKASQAPRGVREHGGAAALRQLPNRDQRCVVVLMPVGEQGGLPGDLLRRVAQEVRFGPLRPDPRDLFRRHFGHFLARLLLRFANQFVLIDRRLEAAAQGALGALVEFLEQPRFPRIPQLRIGAAHVRNGQHVQIIQVRLIADAPRETVNDVGIADVLLLRGDGQDQVVSDQPRDQARLVAAESLFEAERLGIDRPQFRMIAAAALGDVVKQRREIGDFLARQGLHDLAQGGKFVVEFGHREAPQVADDEQGVRVHGVRMEQVVLHPPDDAAEGRDVAAEHTVQIHAAQFVRDSHGRAQDFHEQPVMPRVLAELLVDEPHMRADQTDRLGAHPAQFRVLLQEHEQLEQRRGVAHEYLPVSHFEVIVADLEARIEGQRRSALRQDGLAKQLQQHFVQQAHVHDRAVIFLHQLFDGERKARILVAEHFRELDLIIEQQAILAPPCQHMQPKAHLP